MNTSEFIQLLSSTDWKHTVNVEPVESKLIDNGLGALTLHHVVTGWVQSTLGFTTVHYCEEYSYQVTLAGPVGSRKDPTWHVEGATIYPSNSIVPLKGPQLGMLMPPAFSAIDYSLLVLD